MWLFGNKYKVKCPDGTSRWVYHNINDALPLYISDKKSDLNSKLDLEKLLKVKGELTRKFESRIKGLLFELDSSNDNVMISFRGIYVAYQSDPCGSSDYLRLNIQSIIEDYQNLRLLKTRIKGLIDLLNTNGMREEGILKAYMDIIDEFEKYLPTQATIKKVKELISETKIWIDKK